MAKRLTKMQRALIKLGKTPSEAVVISTRIQAATAANRKKGGSEWSVFDHAV